MELVEIWRVRQVVLWHLGLTVLVVVALALFAGHANIQIDDNEVGGRHAAALGDLLFMAMAVSTVAASWIGLGLNRDRAQLELLFTRPTPRALLALRFVGIDLAALGIVFAVTLAAVCFLTVAVAHPIVTDENTLGLAFLHTGVVAMWYGLLLVVTAGLEGRGAMIAGLMWPIALILLPLGMARSGFLHAVALVLDVFNPFAYVNTNSTAAGNLVTSGVWQVALPLRALEVWLLAAAFCALAIWIWRRREV
jgi:hypothetical protein